MKKVVALLLASLLVGVPPLAAGELPSLGDGEFLVRANPPTSKDFETLSVFGPLWTSAVADYYGIPKSVLPTAKFDGRRYQVWDGIAKLRSLDVSGEAANMDISGIYDFAKAKSPEIGAMTKDEVVRMVLLGQAINIESTAASSSDWYKFCIWFFTCGPPPKVPPKRPPKNQGDPTWNELVTGPTPDYRITFPLSSNR